MKTKKNKKFYNFTEKQKSKDRSKRKTFWSVPSHFRRRHNRFRKAEAKKILHQILKGREVEFVPEKRTVRWDYW